MRQEVIKAKLEGVLKDYSISIYSMKVKREFGEKILEILLKGNKIDSDILGEIHLKLYDLLEDGDLDDDYFLEISSMGAEYLLNNLEEIKEHLNNYVYVKTNKFDLLGYIVSVENSLITFEYNDKGQFKKMKIEYDEILSISTRVKV